MRFFFKKILVNLLIVFLVAILVDITLIVLTYSSNYYIYKDWKLLLRGQINAQIIVNGSSRAVRHINPNVITDKTKKSAYNIGLVSEPGLTQINRLKTYLKYNDSPEILIQVVEPSFIGRPDTIVLKEYYSPYIYEDYIYRSMKEIDKSVWKDKYIPLYKWHGNSDLIFSTLKSFFVHTEQTDKGFLPRNTEWTESEDDSLKTHGLRIKHQKEEIAQMMDSIVAFSQLCYNKNIKLIMLYTPMTTEGQRVFEQNDEIIKKLKGLEKQGHFTYWDYSKSEINLKKMYFYNHTHLNEKGAKLFSQQLAQRLKEFNNEN